MTAIQDTLKQIGSGVARTLIASAGGFLVTEGWLANSKVASFEDAAMGAVAVVGILVWSAAEKLWVYVKAELAKIPPTSVEGQVLAALDTLAPSAEAIAEPVADKIATLAPAPLPPTVLSIPVPQQVMTFTPPILNPGGQ